MHAHAPHPIAGLAARALEVQSLLQWRSKLRSVPITAPCGSRQAGRQQAQRSEQKQGIEHDDQAEPHPQPGNCASVGGSGDRELAQPLEQPLAHQVETLHERDKGDIAALYLELERSKRAVQQRADDEVRCARNVAARAEHEARRARAEVARLMRALQEAQGKAQSHV